MKPLVKAEHGMLGPLQRVHEEPRGVYEKDEHPDSACCRRSAQDTPRKVAKEHCKLRCHRRLHHDVPHFLRHDKPCKDSHKSSREATQHSHLLEHEHPVHVGRPQPKLSCEDRGDAQIVEREGRRLRCCAVGLGPPSMQAPVCIVVAVRNEDIRGCRHCGKHTEAKLNVAERNCCGTTENRGDYDVQHGDEVPQARLVEPPHRSAAVGGARQPGEHVRQACFSRFPRVLLSQSNGHLHRTAMRADLRRQKARHASPCILAVACEPRRRPGWTAGDPRVGESTQQ
mmetsp:Transcript_19529/g.46815  ORF Transcript_19529/g.46815 Transcript_19529/m.46815 type:complete len:284 (+) Transcript_19529:433-1284(+)